MSTPPRVGIRSAAVICYAVALAGAGAFAAQVLLLGLDLWPLWVRLPQPWLVNVGWLLFFGLQHSGMARTRFKKSWTRILPPHLERSCYAATSGLLLLGLAFTWQPLAGEAFWRGPLWLIALPLLAVLGMSLVNRLFDHAGQFGLRQAWEVDRQPTPDRLLVMGPYRYLRHPLMACLLVLLWVQPVMTPTLALLSGGLTAYVLIGVWFEECDLLRRFGPAYAAYRQRVPALLPWRPPAPPATYPAVQS